MKAVRLMALFWLVFVNTVFAKTGSYEFRHLTNAEGLSHNTVNDIVQDCDGYIWIATAEGLNRYNSRDIKTFYADTLKSSLPSNEITALVACSNGKVYIGTNKGACFYNNQKNSIERISFSISGNSHIYDILQTQNNKILFATNKGIVQLNIDSVQNEVLLSDIEIMGFVENADGHIWGFNRFEVFEFFHDGTIINNYRVDIGDKKTNLLSPISCLSINNKNEVIVGTFKQGFLRYNSENHSFESIHNRKAASGVTIDFVRDVKQDSDNNYWLATENGVLVMNENGNLIYHFQQSFSLQDKTINDNAVYKVMLSKENILWFGTYFGGVNYLNLNGSQFKNIAPSNLPGKLHGKAISEIVLGPDNNLWMATEDAGIAIYNPQTSNFRHITSDSASSISLSSNNVHALYVDDFGNVWSGNFLGGINKIDRNGKVLKSFVTNPFDTTSIENDFVFELFPYKKNEIFVGTTNGVDLFNLKTEVFQRFMPSVFNGVFIYDIFNFENKFWFASYNSGLYSWNPSTNKIETYSTQNSSIPGNSIISHLIDSQNQLWIGTRDGGLGRYNSANNKFISYNIDNGLFNNCIYGILEDSHQNIWISSNKGIARLNILTSKIENITKIQGLDANQFNYKSFYKHHDGTMYFGSVNGFCSFNPNNLIENAVDPEIHFSEFKLSNVAIQPGKHSVLKKNINYTEDIKLKYSQNAFTFEFFTLDYFSNTSSSYFFKLEGFDQNWNAVGSQNTATYTNIPPGNYSFSVRISPLDNENVNDVRTIRIQILKPFYQTTLAYISYILMVMLISFFTIRLIIVRQSEKVALRMEKLEKQKVKEIHEHKMNFFTYISHEFKTPLTIILASLDEFIEISSISNQYRTSIESMKRNANRLLALINQLMEFRKIETDHVSIHKQSLDVVLFLREILNSYIPLLSQRKIYYSFHSNVEKASLSFDYDKLEKIVTNLLINAVKNTEEYGSVVLKMELLKMNEIWQLEIFVSDTGKGLSEEQLKNIFEIHYQHEEHEAMIQGSGIGLALTKSLINLLNGTIEVKSKPGEGALFKTIFLIEPDFESDVEANLKIEEPNAINIFSEIKQPVLGVRDFAETEIDFDIYIVEDNIDLRSFLKKYFSKKYRVHTFENGLKAWSKIQKDIPDVVITDVMMPEMDGITLCKNIKENFSTNHIPVILLTAKSDDKNKLLGLSEGADYYVSKPFVVKELELYVENIIKNRIKLKQHIQKTGNTTLPLILQNRTMQFVELITALIIDNIANEKLDVDFLTSNLKISRSLLHNKIKQIFEMSTTEFINYTRLNHAKKMLIEKPNLTISEIAYTHGYKDPNYFSRIFKSLFNTTPKRFREEYNG